jgi:hypothetical protein
MGRNEKMRSFRCETWLFESINEAADQQGLKYSEWIRKTLADALGEMGLTQAAWVANRRNK